MPMGLPLGGKSILTPNISSLIKGLSERKMFYAGRVELFDPSISSEPVDQPLTNLLFCSSNFADKNYLSLFVCG